MRKHAKTCESISSGRKFPIVVDAPPTPKRVRSCLCSCSAGICVAVPSSTRGVHDTRQMLPGIHLGSRSRRKVRSLESCTPAELHATIVNVDELCSTFKISQSSQCSMDANGTIVSCWWFRHVETWKCRKSGSPYRVGFLTGWNHQPVFPHLPHGPPNGRGYLRVRFHGFSFQCFAWLLPRQSFLLRNLQQLSPQLGRHFGRS